MKKLLMGKHCGELHVAPALSPEVTAIPLSLNTYIYNSNTEEPKPDTT